jgi:hypothetical protein
MAKIPQTTDQIMAVIANDWRDPNGLDRDDWLALLADHDLYAGLVIAVCAERHSPAFQRLVDKIDAAIDAELAEL